LNLRPKTLFVIIPAIIILLGFQPETDAQSPYKLNFEREATIFGLGTALTVVTLKLNDDIEPLTIPEIGLLNRSDINSFDRDATYNWSSQSGIASDYLLALSIISPGILSLSDKVRSEISPVITMYFEVLIISAQLPFVAKGITQRIRPLAYNENVPIERKLSQNVKRSFYSGHTSLAFAMAVFLSTVYSDYYPDSDWKFAVWGSSLLTASVIGYLRYESGSHFPTDILTGAIIGGAIGYLIPLIHRSENENLNISFGLARNSTSLNLRLNF